MKIQNLRDQTLINTNFRKVITTTQELQLVLMRLKPQEDIGEEVHTKETQFFRFESGEGSVLVGEDRFEVRAGDSIIVPKGVNHNITNTSDTVDLKFYTIYAPAHHQDNTIHSTKEEAALLEFGETGV